MRQVRAMEFSLRRILNEGLMSVRVGGFRVISFEVPLSIIGMTPRWSEF